jgi:DNA-binding MarR family transcriptional regulator
MKADNAQAQRSLEGPYRRYLAATVLFHLAAADRAGLAAVDYQASNLLDLDGPMSNGELAHRLGLSTGATTRLVDRLVARGLAQRTVAPDDRRRAVIAATGTPPEGLAATLQDVREPIGRAIETLTPEQLDGLRVYLDSATTAYTEAARAMPDAAAPG